MHENQVCTKTNKKRTNDQIHVVVSVEDENGHIGVGSKLVKEV